MSDLTQRISRLQGPILVLGASGFVGANLLRMLLGVRSDVVGTASELPAWRLDGLPQSNCRAVDLLVDANRKALFDDVRPRTVFNCVAYGAYSFETDAALIHLTNFNLTGKILADLANFQIAAYVHAGSSSEYGDLSAGPAETAISAPNSDYGVSKLAASNLVAYFGKKRALPCANLRLYSVYGPYEDASRLIPTLVRHGAHHAYPELVRPDISRDFIYIDDACEAFIDTALAMNEAIAGESFNIGSGIKTTMATVAETARTVFDIPGEPQFTMPERKWDIADWFANPAKAAQQLGWSAKVAFRDGLKRTADWYSALPDKEAYERQSKKHGLDTHFSVSAVIACYKDGQAIPIMYRRLKETFEKLHIEHEIIFVNDNSPDDSEEVIRALTRLDRRVVGISHSRNFGSQQAFRSGMEIATKNACVLLDGDLQDPPELIEQFVAKWREGYDVVYGLRTRRDAPLWMQISYKLFYRAFDRFSYLKIPHDAGDFSLLDRRVVEAMLRFPERDLFLRGVRAFVGFKQVGVGYHRPDRLFGRSTNNLARNIGWAKKGILSFSNTPLTMLSVFGTGFLGVSFVAGASQIIYRMLRPHSTPAGITTLMLIILFFGSINLFAAAVIGEYVAKIFEEVKQRPHFIRRAIITDGELRVPSESARGNMTYDNSASS